MILKVLKWAYLCSLTEDCIAPPGAQLNCRFKQPFLQYAGCHRFDGSMFGSLLLLHIQPIYEQIWECGQWKCSDNYHQPRPGTANSGGTVVRAFSDSNLLRISSRKQSVTGEHTRNEVVTC